MHTKNATNNRLLKVRIIEGLLYRTLQLLGLVTVFTILVLLRFVPDFTISRVSNTLRFKTSTGTELLFPLLAILPHNHLATCYAMQPRPEWEQTIAWLSVPFWLCVLVTMIAAVLLQTNFGYTPVLSYDNDSSLPGKQATGGKVFDLNNIQSSRQEVENTNVSGKNQ